MDARKQYSGCRSWMVWSLVTLLAALGLSPVAVGAPAPVEPLVRELVVEVLQGGNLIHNIHQPEEKRISVRTTDSDGKPVKGAVLVFQLPLTGPSGTFVNGTKFETVMTNADGIGATQPFKANDIAGEWEVVVTASFRNYQSVTESIKQRNNDPQAVPAAVTQQGGGSGKVIAIVLGIAGAAAGAALGLSGGGGSSSSPSPTPSPSPNPTTISPGAPTFGAPR